MALCTYHHEGKNGRWCKLDWVFSWWKGVAYTMEPHYNKTHYSKQLGIAESNSGTCYCDKKKGKCSSHILYLWISV